MPNRILRDCTDSEPINSISDAAEKFFYRLIQKADDFGRFHGHPKLLRPILYPLQLDRIREADLDRLIAECERASLVRRYEADGKVVLEILKFKQQIRSTHSKFPACIADAKQMHGRRTAYAHLDVVVSGDVSVGGEVDLAEASKLAIKAHAAFGPPPSFPSPAVVELARQLLAAGRTVEEITALCDWAATTDHKYRPQKPTSLLDFDKWEQWHEMMAKEAQSTRGSDPNI